MTLKYIWSNDAVRSRNDDLMHNHSKQIKKKQRGTVAFSKELLKKEADSVEEHLGLMDKEFMRQAAGAKEILDKHL